MVGVDAGHLVHRDMFLDVPGVFDPGHPGGVTFPANGQVPQFTHPAAMVIVNGFSLELTEKEFPQYPQLFHGFPSLEVARHNKRALPLWWKALDRTVRNRPSSLVELRHCIT